MRRRPLSAPRPVFPAPEIRVDGSLADEAPAGGSVAARRGWLGRRAGRSSRDRDPLPRETLADPDVATPRVRRLFDPVRGWFRRLERKASCVISRRLFPWFPGIRLPYAVQLDRRLTVSEAEVRLPGLPAAFDGASVLLITDIHAGPFLSPACLTRTFRRLGGLAPDLILIGGDLATTRVGELIPTMNAFASLSAPLGVYGVLGNHDHYTEDPELLVSLVEKAGVRLLQNRAVALERDGGRLVLAGIDDLNSGASDLDAALAEADELRRPTGRSIPDGSKSNGAPVILLSHNPDVFFDAARRGVSLVLAGHTHGGQVRLPGLPVLVRMSRYRLDQGRYCFNGSELIVSRGLGASGLPLRIGCPPEAVRITLRHV